MARQDQPPTTDRTDRNGRPSARVHPEVAAYLTFAPFPQPVCWPFI